MDTLTHSLVAVTLSRAGLRRVCPKATLLLLIAANIPDVDLLALLKSPLAALELHAGYTHSLLGLPPLAVLSVFLTGFISRTRLPFRAACLLAFVGVASHLLLDYSGSYGIRALLPFSSQWSYLDIIGFYDAVIWAALLLALLWPWFVNLVSAEIGRSRMQGGQGSAIAVLLLLSLYAGGRWSLHQQALSKLSSRTYDDQAPRRVSALAESNNPFEWTGIVETADAFRIVKIGWIDLGASSDSRVFRKPPEYALRAAVMPSEPFRYMAYFARFPVWSFEPVEVGSSMGQKIDLTDLRFGTPEAGEFHAVALADGTGQVRDFQFSLSNIRH